jgi:16S rRNA (uracil1498-N3)-methyltransferase
MTGERRSLRRFFVAAPGLDGDTVVFAPREAHHIARVLRLGPGTRVIAFDGACEAEVELSEIGTIVRGRRVGAPRPARRPLEITLLQGVARGPKMDLIVRMATEIGVAVVRPVLTARAVPDPGETRVARWRRIAREAARQCGRADVPEVPAPAPLPDALSALGPVDLLLVPWEEEDRPIGRIVAGRRLATAGIVIGPEGGLAPEEVRDARAAGGETVSLGPLVLRTETAGVVAAAMLFYERLLR